MKDATFREIDGEFELIESEEGLDYRAVIDLIEKRAVKKVRRIVEDLVIAVESVNDQLYEYYSEEEEDEDDEDLNDDEDEDDE